MISDITINKLDKQFFPKNTQNFTNNNLLSDNTTVSIFVASVSVNVEGSHPVLFLKKDFVRIFKIFKIDIFSTYLRSAALKLLCSFYPTQSLTISTVIKDQSNIFPVKSNSSIKFYQRILTL